MDRPRAGDLVGYWRKGRPIYLPGGGSTPPEPQQQPPGGPPPGTIPINVPPPAPAPPTPITSEQLAQLQEQWQRDAEARLAAQRTELETDFNNRLAPFETERAERERQAAEAEAERLRLEQAAIEAQETATQRQARLEQETAGHIQRLMDELAARDALAAREREFNAVQAYRGAQLLAHTDDIHPSMHRLVKGLTNAEIDASVADAVAASTELVAEIAGMNQGQQQQIMDLRRAQPGVGITAPPNGPIDGLGTTRNLTATDIKNMDPAEYAANREQLLATAGAAYRQANGYQ